MPLETGTTIAQLAKEYPTASDPVNQGDDHIRLLKSVLQHQFPGANGGGFNTTIVTTEQELNWSQGLRSNIQAQIDDLGGLIGPGGIEGQVVTNTNDIAILQDDVIINAGNISSNDSDINTNANNINANANNISTNTNNINTNTNNINANANNISTNAADIITLENRQHIKMAGLFSGATLQKFCSGDLFNVNRNGGEPVGSYIVTFVTPANGDFVITTNSAVVTIAEVLTNSSFIISTATLAGDPIDVAQVHFMIVDS